MSQSDLFYRSANWNLDKLNMHANRGITDVHAGFSSNVFNFNRIVKVFKSSNLSCTTCMERRKTVTCSKPRSLATFRSTTSARLRCSQPWTAKWSWCFRKILTTVETIAQAISMLESFPIIPPWTSLVERPNTTRSSFSN